MGLTAFIPAACTLLFYLPIYAGIMNELEDTYYHALAATNGRVIEYINRIKEIKIFGRSNDAYGKFENAIEEYRSSTLRLYHKMQRATAPALVLLSSIPAGVLCVGGLLYSSNSLTPTLYLFCIVVSVCVGPPLLKFTEFMDNFYHIRNGASLVNTVLSAPELIQTDVQRVPLEGHEIVFDKVSFAYQEKSVLSGMSLVFREGRKTALVGPSGAGKSTVANLVARFWDAGGGTISLGGVDYRDIPLNQLMENINYVTQEPFLFNVSIRENLLVGKPDATENEVIRAARSARCDEFINELEHGYDTVAGDAGAKLSGGQRQRIIIACAILRNAPVLILDEATAFADMENQRKIQESLSELCRNKTLILIAHRLSTVTDCDQIAVIDEGKVSATGTHEALLESSSLYRRMWEAYVESAAWSAGKCPEASSC
jgi:ATP-binding cassette subfamily B protein